MKKVCEVNNCVNNFKAFVTNYESHESPPISSKFQQQPAAEVLLLFISLLLLLVSQCRLAALASPYFTILCKICSAVAALPAVVLLFSFLSFSASARLLLTWLARFTGCDWYTFLFLFLSLFWTALHCCCLLRVRDNCMKEFICAGLNNKRQTKNIN